MQWAKLTGQAGGGDGGGQVSWCSFAVAPLPTGLRASGGGATTSGAQIRRFSFTLIGWPNLTWPAVLARLD